MYISPSENIYTDKELSDNSTTNDEIDVISDQKSDNNTVNKANDKSEDNNLVMILAIAFGVYFLISIIVFIMLMSKNKKLKNNLGSSN